MIRVLFIFCSVLVVFVMLGLYLFLQKDFQKEGSLFSPLERGLRTVGKVCSFFSLQFFTILVLFLIFDLEVVLVAGFLLGGESRAGRGRVFLLFILFRLWAE